MPPFPPCPPSNSDARFTNFGALPSEIRLAIWEFALPGPRIVHLSKKEISRGPDPDWWRQVRSDKPIDGPDPEFYGDCGFDTRDLVHVEQKIAAERLLSTDAKHSKSMTSSQAKAILRQQFMLSACSVPGSLKLFGFQSESPNPSLLLTCHESHSVAVRHYKLAFPSLGSISSVYIDFQRDTLLLDDLSHSDIEGWRPHPSKLHHWDAELFIKRNLRPEEMAQVQHLAIQWRHIWEHASETKANLTLYARLFPNLKSFTVVEQHFSIESRSRKTHYQDLNFVDSSIETTTGDFRLNGYRVDLTIRRPAQPEKLIDDRVLREAKDDWEAQYGQGSWKFPDPVYKTIISRTDEMKVLQAAFEYEKEHGEGVWYVNPDDPNDCDFFAE